MGLLPLVTLSENTFIGFLGDSKSSQDDNEDLESCSLIISNMYKGNKSTQMD